MGTGYRKCKLAGWRERWDVYLIDFPAGSEIPTHTDPVPGREHWRANFTLFGDREVFQGKAVIAWGPLVVFRPDITPHSVSRINRHRLVLSFGFTKGGD